MKNATLILGVVGVLVACAEPVPGAGTEDEVAMADVAQLERTVDDCFDDYRTCASGCLFDWDCRVDCIDDLFDCLRDVDTGTDDGSGSSSSSCSRSTSSNGTSYSADCDDGECTCSENGVETGTCTDDGAGACGACCGF